MMTNYEILQKIMADHCLSPSEFGNKIGKNENFVSVIKTGATANFSPKVIRAIVDAFPEYSPDWLRTGEPPIYSNVEAHRVSQSIIGSGDHNTVTATPDRLLTLMEGQTAAILERWNGWDDRLALPALSNQRSNKRLKELGRLAGIDEPVRITYFKGSQRFDEIKPKWQVLTTHAARRTFVVTALTLGIPAEVVMKWTGHSDYKAMKPYIAIVDELKAEKMRLFDTLPAAAPPSAPPEDGRTESQTGYLKLTTGKKSP